MIIAVDFDGTIVDHRFPEIGEAVPYAVSYLTALQRCHNVRLMLYTMRSDLRDDGVSDEGHKPDRDYLTEAVEWCRERGIEFWAVNKNPEQASWTTSPKPYAHIYVDDAAFGCPLKENPRHNGRPYVDWKIVGEALLDRVGAPDMPGRGSMQCVHS